MAATLKVNTPPAPDAPVTHFLANPGPVQAAPGPDEVVVTEHWWRRLENDIHQLVVPKGRVAKKAALEGLIPDSQLNAPPASEPAAAAKPEAPAAAAVPESAPTVPDAAAKPVTAAKPDTAKG